MNAFSNACVFVGFVVLLSHGAGGERPGAGGGAFRLQGDDHLATWAEARRSAAHLYALQSGRSLWPPLRPAKGDGRNSSR